MKPRRVGLIIEAESARSIRDIRKACCVYLETDGLNSLDCLDVLRIQAKVIRPKPVAKKR